MSKANISSFELDLNNPAALTEAQQKNIVRLNGDEKVDLSDIPELDELFWKKAYRVGATGLYRPHKKIVNMYFDVDVIAWAKSKGKGYQTRLNQIVRKAMLDEMHH